MSLSFASGLRDMVSGAAPSDVYDFPFPLRFTSAVRTIVRSYRDRRDLFPEDPVSEPTAALAQEILAAIQKYCDEVETLFKLDKSSDVVKLNRDAAASGSRVSFAYRNFSTGFCDDLTAVWRRGWDEIERLGIGHVFDRSPDSAVEVEIGVLAYDMAVILLLLNAFSAFFSDAVRAEFDRFQGDKHRDVEVACLVVARRCLPDFTGMTDALFKVYKGSGTSLAKFDLQTAVSTLGFTVVLNPDDVAEAEEEERAKIKRNEELFFVPVDQRHTYDRPYLLLQLHPKGPGIPVGYVPIGPPLFEDNGHVQAFTNRMVDLFPMLVGVMLPPAAPTLAELAGPNVLRELGKA